MSLMGDERTIGVSAADAYDPDQIKDVGLTTCGEWFRMGFMDKAKAAANELAAKADTALAGSGLGGPGAGGERLLRDLGVLTYLEAAGRPVPPGELDRVLGQLREAEQRGALPNLALQTAAGQPGSVPPPPGAAAGTPPPPGANTSAPPSPGAPAGTPPPAPSAPETGPTVQPTAPPPPPPTWASDS
jgi:hypothetical protein